MWDGGEGEGELTLMYRGDTDSVAGPGAGYGLRRCVSRSISVAMSWRRRSHASEWP